MKPSVCLKDELFCLIKSFNDEGAEYVLCGSLALAVHGFVRAGDDIDLLVPQGSINRVIQLALMRGLTNVAVKTKAGLRSHKLTKGVGTDRMAVDVQELPDTLSEVWNARKMIKLGDVDCCMVSREGLIHMKSNSGRSQDRVDVERLIYDDDPFEPTVGVRIVDMSPKGILERIDLASQLYSLCMFLAGGKLITDAAPASK